jgi:hypothetical protein
MENQTADREELLRRYVALKEQAKEIDAQIESLKSNIFFAISQMQDEIGEKQINFEDYVFSVSYRKTFDYPKHVKEMEERLKATKKESEASGEAVIKSESGYVILKKKDG